MKNVPNCLHFTVLLFQRLPYEPVMCVKDTPDKFYQTQPLAGLIPSSGFIDTPSLNGGNQLLMGAGTNRKQTTFTDVTTSSDLMNNNGAGGTGGLVNNYSTVYSGFQPPPFMVSASPVGNCLRRRGSSYFSHLCLLWLQKLD